jgi:tRNA (mo5U34)-methyltransferase
MTHDPSAPRITRSTVERRVRELAPWFHNLDLLGVQTAPEHFLGDYPRVKWQGFAQAIPEDLHGMSVLDIGCNAGFFALEMKRRGAERVLGIDSDPRYLAQAALASSVLGLPITLQQLSVYEVSTLREHFDWVFFTGVLYHLRYPLLALDLIRKHVVRNHLVFQSMQRGSQDVFEPEPDYPFSEQAIFDRAEFPRLHFVEHKYSNDETNWWIPNRSCVEAMLRSSGFDILAHPEAEVYVCKRSATAQHWAECDLLERTLP